MYENVTGGKTIKKNERGVDENFNFDRPTGNWRCGNTHRATGIGAISPRK